MRKPQFRKRTRYEGRLDSKASIPISELLAIRSKWSDRIGFRSAPGIIGGGIIYGSSVAFNQSFERGVVILGWVVAGSSLALGIKAALSPKEREKIRLATLDVKKGFVEVARSDANFLDFLKKHRNKYAIIDHLGRIEIKDKDRRLGIGRIRIKVSEILEQAGHKH